MSDAREHDHELEDKYDVLEHALSKVHGPRRKGTTTKTETEVFDEPTMMALYKLINQGHFNTLDFPISTGKEANVFHASSDTGPVAVKIYRIHTSTFNTHLGYILGDHRFEDIRPTKRGIVDAWAKKEHRNLADILAIGIPVPTPLTVHKNIVVMGYVGDENGPAPQLKDMAPADPAEVVNTLIDWIVRLWKEAELAHGDLSEYNTLVYDDELVLIDVGQAVPAKHPRSLELLERDIQNVARYSKRIHGPVVDVKDVLNTCLEDH